MGMWFLVQVVLIRLYSAAEAAVLEVYVIEMSRIAEATLPGDHTRVGMWFLCQADAIVGPSAAEAVVDGYL